MLVLDLPPIRRGRLEHATQVALSRPCAPRLEALAGALCGLVATTVVWAPAAWLARGG